MTSRLLQHVPLAAIAAAVVALALLLGGYHPRHWTWAALALIVLAGVQAVRGHLPALGSSAGIVLAAGVGLTLWSALSVQWALFSRHLAWDEANRVLMYVAAFAVGAAFLATIGSFIRFVGWLAAAISTVGLVTLARMLGDDGAALFLAGRLDWPIGYSNGIAAFFMIGVWLLLGLSCAIDRVVFPAPGHLARTPSFVQAPEQRTGLRFDRSFLQTAALASLTLGGAALLACLAFMAQSRGAAAAAFLALVVALVVMPTRLSLLVRIGVVAFSVAVVAGSLNEPFGALNAAAQAANDHAADADQRAHRALDAVRGAARSTVLATLIATALGFVVAVLHHALITSRERLRFARVVGAVTSAVALGVLLAVLAVRGFSPVDFVERQYRALANPAVGEAAAEQPAGAAESHYAELGTNRGDFWRVSWTNFRDNPITGIGANNFGGSYVLQRTGSGEEPRQAHSLPLQVLGDLGAVGGLLLLAMVLPVLAAMRLYVISGERRDPAFGGAITAIAYWGAHTSVDWLWNLPAVTLGVVVLAGGLVSCVSRVQRRLTTPVAIAVSLGVLVLGVASLLPQAVADRAYRSARIAAFSGAPPTEVVEHAQRAAYWDPTWAEPVMLQARTLYGAGNRKRAAQLARDAAALEPNNWAIRLQASQVLNNTGNAREAQRHLRKAIQLNPQLRR